MRWKQSALARLTPVALIALVAALMASPGGVEQLRAQSQTSSSPSSPPPAQPSADSAGQRSSSAQAGVAPAPMQPAELQALLYKIYTANFRVGDLTGALPIDQWKLADQDASALRKKADALRDSAAKVEKARSDFYNHPDDSALGQGTAAALQALPPQIDDFEKALESTPGASFVKDYQQAASDLRDHDRQIEPYIAYLQAKNPAAAPPPSAAPAPTPAAPAPAETQPATPPAPSQNAPLPSQTQTAPAQPAAQPAQTPPPAEAPPAPAAAQPAPAAAPATATEATSHAAVTPAAMQPAEAQALLYKIYAANFRVGDLTGSLGIDQWKLGDQDRASLSQKSETLRTSVATLEKARSDFYNHPDDLALGQATTAAIQSLLPKIDDFAAALGNTPGANNAKDYQQAASDLRSLDNQLEPYVAYLEAKNQPPPAPAAPAGVNVETEVVKPSAAVPPLTVAAPEKPPISNDQLKTLLYQAYVPAFRIKDLLGQEHPEHWQIPDAERTVYSDAAQALTKRLADLANWRDQLEVRPDSLEAAFEVYAALDKVAEPAGIVGHMVSQYDDPKVGSEYVQKAEQVAEFRNQIEPYVGYLLRRHDEVVGTVERNFVKCETELTSVMRPTVVAAEPMKNVLPVFRGRGRRVARGTAPHKATSHANKNAKPASSKPSPSGSSPGQ